MESVTLMQSAVTVIELLCLVGLLITMLARFRGQHRTFGVLGAALMLASMVLSVVGIQLVVRTASMDNMTVYTGAIGTINIFTSLLTGLGLILIAYAIGSAVRSWHTGR